MGITISFDGTGLAPVAPIVDLPTGVYKVKCVSVKQEPKKDDQSKFNALFELSVIDDKLAGAPARIYLGLDTSNKFIARQWMTAMLSAGVPAASVGKPTTLDTDNFVGKTMHIHNQEGELDPSTGKRGYADRTFITPELFASMKAAAPVGAVATGAQTAAPGTAPAATGNGIPQPATTAAALTF